jgi:hypothetical protein
MKRLLSGLALVLPLAGCMLPGGGGPSYDAALDAPLRVRLYADLNTYQGASQRTSSMSRPFQVSLNQPAHVAVFELRPGQGAMLVYPAGASRQQQLSGGSNLLHVDWFHVNRFGWQTLGAMPTWQGTPRYFMVVASKRPLRVDALMASPHALRREMGFARFASMHPFSLMDEIVDHVVPMQHDDDWASDVYVQWPMPATMDANHRDASRLVRVTCQDGRSILIPAYAIAQSTAICDQTRVRPQMPDSTRSDSASIRRPDSRRPVPVTAGGGEEERPATRQATRRAGMSESGRPAPFGEQGAIRPSERERAGRAGVVSERGARPERGEARTGARPSPSGGETPGRVAPTPRPESPRPQRPEPRSEPRTEVQPSSPAPAPSAGEPRPGAERPTPPRSDG